LAGLIHSLTRPGAAQSASPITKRYAIRRRIKRGKRKPKNGGNAAVFYVVIIVVATLTYLVKFFVEIG
jgi:hypothetical protein